MFTKRLKDYREKEGMKKNEFAIKLGVSESFYNMIENGKKSASKNFMTKLVSETGKPEEYWIYGISGNEYISIREDLKSTKKAIDTLLELGLINDVDKLFENNETGTSEEVLIAALKADIDYILKKRSNKVK